MRTYRHGIASKEDGKPPSFDDTDKSGAISGYKTLNKGLCGMFGWVKKYFRGGIIIKYLGMRIYIRHWNGYPWLISLLL